MQWMETEEGGELQDREERDKENNLKAIPFIMRRTL